LCYKISIEKEVVKMAQAGPVEEAVLRESERDLRSALRGKADVDAATEAWLYERGLTKEDVRNSFDCFDQAEQLGKRGHRGCWR
jgi:hypothetical protein